MKKILLASLKQETASFNPVQTEYDSFQVSRGEEIFDYFRNTDTEIGGAIAEFAEHPEVKIIPCFSAQALSGGTITDETISCLSQELITSISSNLPADGILLILHGAMVGNSEFDPEGSVLSELRSLIGTVPLVGSLDLHAVLTDRMVENADCLVPFHTYPHIDQYETGIRAARCLLTIMEQKRQVTVVRKKLPMLVRGDELLTSSGLFGKAMDMCRGMERSEHGISAGILIGNPFADVPELNSSVLAYSTEKSTAIEKEVDKIAEFLWQHRHRFVADLVSIEEAAKIAEEERRRAGHDQTAVTDDQSITGIRQPARVRNRPKFVVFSDAADATSSGASGDSNAILKGLMKYEYHGRSLSSIVDAPAVDTVFKKGVGQTVQINLGGSLDPERFTPIPVEVYVKSLFDGNFMYENGTKGIAGRSAVVLIENHTVLVSQRPIWISGMKVYQEHGVDPLDYDLVVVKSPNGFRPYYESHASRIVVVDVPGSTSPNLLSFPYKRVGRPIFPLDNEAELLP